MLIGRVGSAVCGLWLAHCHVQEGQRNGREVVVKCGGKQQWTCSRATGPSQGEGPGEHLLIYVLCHILNIHSPLDLVRVLVRPLWPLGGGL